MALPLVTWDPHGLTVIRETCFIDTPNRSGPFRTPPPSVTAECGVSRMEAIAMLLVWTFCAKGRRPSRYGCVGRAGLVVIDSRRCAGRRTGVGGGGCQLSAPKTLRRSAVLSAVWQASKETTAGGVIGSRARVLPRRCVVALEVGGSVSFGWDAKEQVQGLSRSINFVGKCGRAAVRFCWASSAAHPLGHGAVLFAPASIPLGLRTEGT